MKKLSLNGWRRLLAPAAVALAALLGACSSEEPETPAEEPDDGSARTTVVVYMVADNSLGREGYDTADLREMQMAVDDGVLGRNGRLFVYHDPYARQIDDTPAVPRLLELAPHADPQELAVYDNDIPSTTPERMRSVTADVVRLSPDADHYGIVLWSHGSGWINEQGARGTVSDRPVASYGDDRGEKMSVASLAQGLDGRFWDFIYFDCCHMATVEVAYALRGSGSLMVGSAAEVPSEGMPYQLTLPHIYAPDGPDMVGVASTVYGYFGSKTGDNRTCTISVIALPAVGRLAQATRRLMATGALPAGQRSDYQVFTQEYFGYYLNIIHGSLYDLRQWMTSLEPAPDEALVSDWLAALADVVVYEAATPYIFSKIAIREHCGLAAYMPLDPAEIDRWGFDTTAWWADVMAANPSYL